MAEGKNQPYEDPHKHLSAWQGARVMQVTGAGKKKEIPGNLLLCGMLVPQPSHKNDVLFGKIQKLQGELPALKHSCSSSVILWSQQTSEALEFGYMDLLPHIFQAYFRTDGGQGTVPTKSHSHHGLAAKTGGSLAMLNLP